MKMKFSVKWVTHFAIHNGVLRKIAKYFAISPRRNVIFGGNMGTIISNISYNIVQYCMKFSTTNLKRACNLNPGLSQAASDRVTVTVPPERSLPVGLGA